ncbi:CDGSH iron-sulfur domain-containing protein [Nocardia tengchongensis]|uniref:CDGSH iron-sulfur domain-containing protein n=1 Tax=Nocardia tengchongensis TaxID=2055889 RepID=A0ABX8CIJ4_9NOCA|nr:CDGSH iron-sulfur domain-containing protein [Nocardia tengchongensis]QVI19787.1 CDGSH iron-sulfur domain-containing protein [Nocardia tengchongensis]
MSKSIEKGERGYRRITIVGDGPALVEGPVELVREDGTTVRSDRFLVAVCLCRRSKIFPLCDSSHRTPARRATE